VMTPHNEPDLTFEQAMQRLEEIVERLETGVHALPLDEIVRLYEEGQRLRQFCEQYLAEAEQRITVIKSDAQHPAFAAQAVQELDEVELEEEVFTEEDFEVEGDPFEEMR
jgi:exodeoxyribonuclease VII small subunit